MKKKVLKNLHFAFMAVLTALPLGSVAQSAIYSFNYMESEFAIIRSYKDNVDIDFSFYLSRMGFNYIDRNSGNVYHVPFDYPVNDIEILGDTLYFCGSYDYGNAMYGFFKISDVFFNNGDINYCIAHIPFFLDNTYSVIGSLSRLEVKKTLSGEIHMLMVGSGYWYDENIWHYGSHYYYPGVIMDALIDNSGLSNVVYTMDTTNSIHYDDVALTDDFAVVTATMDNSISQKTHNIFYYNHPALVNENYFSCYNYPVTNNILVNRRYNNISDFYLYAHIIPVIGMEADSFATAVDGFGMEEGDGMVVSIYDAPTNPPVERFVLPGIMGVKEMAYNKTMQTLYIINSSYIYAIPYPFVNVYMVRTVDVDYHWFFIDNTFDEHHEILSGTNWTVKQLWKYDDQISEHECENLEDLEKIDISKIEYTANFEQKIKRYRFDVRQIRPRVITINLEKKCGED